MNKYYIAINGSEQGPFSLEELRACKISKTTMVWTEGMESWLEAYKVEELKNLIRTIPPPIPTNIDKTIKVEAEISKKKEKLVSLESKVVFARETKFVFKQIIYGLIIGALSFPIFYFAIYQTNRYNDLHVSEKMTTLNLEPSKFPFPIYEGDHYAVKRYIEGRKKVYTEKSFYSAFITILAASALLIIFRYISKGVKWIQETSKKEI